MRVILTILWLAVPAIAQSTSELALAAEGSAEEMGSSGLRIRTYADVVVDQPVSRLHVRLRDDSPGDGEFGAAFFYEDIKIADGQGNVVTTRQHTAAPALSYHPTLHGGFRREGFLSADGEETIVVTYDFDSADYDGPNAETITRLDVTLLVANDYRIDLLVGDAVVGTIGSEGNVHNGENQVFVRFGIRIASATAIAPRHWADVKLRVAAPESCKPAVTTPG